MPDGFCNRQLSKGKFYLNTDIESFVTSRKNRLHIVWIRVDIVYIPMNVFNDHWVMCKVYLRFREIIIYDFTSHAYSSE